MSKPKIGLAVSGGGYRATLYSLGMLWRLNDFGLLSRLATITSVSGGSITTGYLAHHWDQLIFDENGIATNFDKVVAEPLRIFCSQELDTAAIIAGLFSFRHSIGDKIAQAYDKRLFHGASIQSLSDNSPEFIFYGTNFQTGSSVRIQKPCISDYKIGTYPNPDISLAKTVAISSACPPVLSPIALKTDPTRWQKTAYAEYFDNEELRSKMLLTDGGLYDNLGLEAIWKGAFSNDQARNGEEKSLQDVEDSYSHVLACDAGAPFRVYSKMKSNWWSQLSRMGNISSNQQRALRKRWLIENYINQKYGGAYFGISTKIDSYKFDDAMARDSDLTSGLQYIRTRLNAFNQQEQGHLINWGYAMTDTAIRKHVRDLPSEALLRKGEWPLPEYAL